MRYTKRDGMYLKSMIKLEKGELKAAELSFKQLLKLYPDFSDGHCYYANCLADLNKKDCRETLGRCNNYKSIKFNCSLLLWFMVIL